MLYVLFKSLFHNGERYKYTFHRKQFVFKRRVSFLLSLSSSAPLHSQSSCTISTTRANQDQGQGYFLAPKVSETHSSHLGFHSPPASAYLLGRAAVISKYQLQNESVIKCKMPISIKSYISKLLGDKGFQYSGFTIQSKAQQMLKLRTMSS